MLSMPRRAVLALALMASLTACANPPSDAASAPSAAPVAAQRISFLDTEAFERQVQGALSDGTEVVEISMLVPASANSLPPRLSKVLSSVQDAGGQVSVKAVPDEAGKSLALLGLLPTVVEAAQAARQRMAYRGYDAEISVVDGNVTRVRLKKTPAKP